MTEEDQKLVADAALHGARFYRKPGGTSGSGQMWCIIDSIPGMTKWTVGRAAEFYLWKNGLRTNEQHNDYDRRTDVYDQGQDIDPKFLESVLA